MEVQKAPTFRQFDQRNMWEPGGPRRLFDALSASAPGDHLLLHSPYGRRVRFKVLPLAAATARNKVLAAGCASAPALENGELAEWLELCEPARDLLTLMMSPPYDSVGEYTAWRVLSVLSEEHCEPWGELANGERRGYDEVAPLPPEWSPEA